MINGKARLKVQTQASITKVFKTSLDDIELVLATIEAMISKYPELGDNGSFNFKYVQEVFSNSRKRILGAGNDEIRKMHNLIDSLDIETPEGYDQIIFYN